MIQIREYTKAELRLLLSYPGTDLSNPGSTKPMSQRRFKIFTESLFITGVMNGYSYEQFKKARVIPIKAVKVILSEAGLNVES